MSVIVLDITTTVVLLFRLALHRYIPACDVLIVPSVVRTLCTVSLLVTEVSPVLILIRGEVSVMMTLLKNHLILTVSIPQCGVVHWTLTEQVKVYVVVVPAIDTELGDFVKETLEIVIPKWKKHKSINMYISIHHYYINTNKNLLKM